MPIAHTNYSIAIRSGAIDHKRSLRVCGVSRMRFNRLCAEHPHGIAPDYYNWGGVSCLVSAAWHSCVAAH